MRGWKHTSIKLGDIRNWIQITSLAFRISDLYLTCCCSWTKKNERYLGNSSDDIRLIGGSKGVDHLAENERHERLRDAIGDGADGADGHQDNVEAIGEREEFIERDLLFISSIGRDRRRDGGGGGGGGGIFVAAVHGGSGGCRNVD